MLRKLLIVFASGVILSIVAFSGAWLVGGERFRQDIAAHGMDWNFGDDDDDGPRRTRNFAIQPGSQIAMEVPVQLSFERGETSGMTVTGPARLVDRLVWEDGRLSIKGVVQTRHGLDVRITAPEIAGFDFDAPGDVTLEGLDQKSLRLTSNGAIDLDASGKVDTVEVRTAGAGNVDLEKLAARDALVRMDGAGNVTLGASGTVDVEINGVGNVTLTRQPKVLHKRIHGIGGVDHDY